MFLFYRLLLAHFLSDSIFQPITKSNPKIVLHALTFMILSATFLFTYLENLTVVLFIVVISLFYLFIDYFKATLCSISNHKDNLWFFLIDQTVRIFLLSGVIYLPYTTTPRYTLIPIIRYIYNHTQVIIWLILFLVAISMGSLFLYYVKQLLTYERTPFKRDLDGMIERGLIIILIILGKWWLFAVPFVILARVYYYLSASGHLQNWANIINREEPKIEYQKLKLKEDLIIDLALSPAFAISSGILYYFLV